MEVISSMQINHIEAGKLHELGGSGASSPSDDILFYFVKDSTRCTKGLIYTILEFHGY